MHPMTIETMKQKIQALTDAQLREGLALLGEPKSAAEKLARAMMLDEQEQRAIAAAGERITPLPPNSFRSSNPGDCGYYRRLFAADAERRHNLKDDQ
jgi:hypothetical protein